MEILPQYVQVLGGMPDKHSGKIHFWGGKKLWFMFFCGGTNYVS